MMAERKLPALVHNVISYAGAVIAGVAGSSILFLFITDLISGIPNPYVGILLFLVLPAFLVTGLLLIPLGMYLRWRTQGKGGGIVRHRWPSLDLNERQQRNAVLIFVLGSLIFVLMSTVGIYQAYRFTDSVTFCAKTCHSVMVPEYTTFRRSPHARLKCVECHIGPGAGWYARSKLSGLYQVYATLAGIYPRPIPNPISDLRPVKEDCELCHWPRQFFGQDLTRFDHYLYDKANTHWSIMMLIKTGGQERGTGRVQGIHWHTAKNMKVEYISKDAKLQNILLVKVTDLSSGKSRVYRDRSVSSTDRLPGTGAWRIMDCIDCHNHPSHIYHSPDYEIDSAIAAGRIDAGIPDIKKTAVTAMGKNYKSDAEAMDGIEQTMSDYYQKNYPEFFSENRVRIDEAIKAIRLRQYARRFHKAYSRP